MSDLRKVGYSLLAGVAAVITLSDKPAAAEEMTLVLCETSGSTVRIYEDHGQVLMRAYNRQLGRVWMNHTPTEIKVTANGVNTLICWGSWLRA